MGRREFEEEMSRKQVSDRKERNKGKENGRMKLGLKGSKVEGKK